jgi:AraC-like DNA-binding protein
LPGILLVLVSVAALVAVRPLVIYRAGEKSFNSGAFSDADFEGSSRSRMRERPEYLLWEYTINDGIEYPYAGLTFNTEGLTGIDTIPYNRLKLRFRGTPGGIINVQLRYYIPGLTDRNLPLSYRFFIRSLPVTDRMRTVIIPLKRFVTPPWWFKQVGLNDDFRLIDYRIKRHFYGVEFTSHENVERGKPCTLELEAAELLPPVWPWWLAITAALSFSAAFELVSRRKKRMASGGGIKDLRHLEIGNIRDVEEKKLFGYLYENYNDPVLSLEKLLGQTALPEKKVSALIRQRSGMTFKGFLNHLRLEESRRLLRETDRNVTEIAFLVGYNSCSHFNRVFHAAEGVTPTAYRLTKRV